MPEYMLAIVDQPDRVAEPRGVLVASEESDQFVFVVAASGTRASDPPGIHEAVGTASSHLPYRADATPVHDWFTSMSGMRFGNVCIVGPFSWNAEPREIEHWAISQYGLQACEIPTPTCNRRGRAAPPHTP